MRDLGTKYLLVAGFVLALIHSVVGNDACLAELSSIPRPSEETNAAADKGKNNLIKFIQNDPERAASIGFSSENEVTSDKINVGSGIPVVEIDAQSLLDKPEFKNMSAYLKPLDRFMYPITVDGKARAAIFVQKLKKAGWKAASFGSPGLVSALEELKLLDRDGVFIALYSPLGVWLACTGLDDKSQCRPVTANAQAFVYKKDNKVWPDRGPVKREPIGEAGTGAEGGIGRAELPAPRAEPEPGRAEPPARRAEPELGRPEPPVHRAEPELGRAELPSVRAEAESGGVNKKEIPLVSIGKGEDGAAILRGLADTTRKMPSFDEKTSRLKSR